MSDEGKFRPKVTYLSKDAITCPTCGHSFYREIMLTGGGRLSAGDVTDTLHRQYKPSQKFGIIHPLIYSLVTCPDCFYTTLTPDFTKLPDDKIDMVASNRQNRINFANKIIGAPVDYSMAKVLENGAASYALAVGCYDYFTKKAMPTIKQAICSMRTAYLFEDLENEKPGKNYKFIAELFYKKALFFYKRAIELNQSKEEIMESMKSYGPDIDKNYGYDGILYLVGILTYKYGSKTDKDFRILELDEAKLFLGKLFGLGKTDYDKPKEILEKSKDFHELISKEKKALNGEE